VAQPIEIIWKTSGIDKVLSAVKKAEQSFVRLNKAANAYTGGMSSDLNKAASSLQSAASAINAAAGKFSAAAKAVGGTGGAGGARGGSRSPKSWSQKLNSLFMSSRIGMSGGGAGGMQIMPLVGKLASLLGPEVMAAIAVIEAIKTTATALFDLTKSAAAAAASFDKFRFSLGSGSGTAAALKGIGGSIGVSPEGMAGIANSVQNAISSSSMGAAFAAGMGIRNIPGPFGNQDYGKQLLRVIDGLRAIKDREERVRVARTMGAEGLLPATELSEGQYGKVKKDATISSAIFDAGMQQKSVDFLSSLNRVSEAVQNLMGALGKGFITRFTQFFNNLADAINKVAVWADKHRDLAEVLMKIAVPILAVIDIIVRALNALADAFRAVRAAIQGDYGAAGKYAHQAMNDLTDPNRAANDALNSNTNALNNNTDSTNKLTGTFGRSDRQARAIPFANEEVLRHALVMGGVRLSGF
jgi:hypothetical protein